MLNSNIFPLLKYLHTKADRAHNFKHLENVVAELQHALASSRYDHLADWHKNALIAGAWLHEVDDKKLHFIDFIYPYQTPENPHLSDDSLKKEIREIVTFLSVGEIIVPWEKITKYPLANALLSKYGSSEEFNNLVLEIISLVSCRDNHHSTLPEDERWKLLLRDADRSQAIGEVGIARCYIYTLDSGNPLFTTSTLRCQTHEDLLAVATPQRFAQYQGSSESFISHFYDKLLHLDKVSSDDDYFQTKMQSAMTVVKDFILDFGQNGYLDVIYLESLVEKYC